MGFNEEETLLHMQRALGSRPQVHGQRQGTLYRGGIR
jgi:hypothetical protein